MRPTRWVNGGTLVAAALDDGGPHIWLRRYFTEEAFVPSKAKYKKSGGGKDFADKNTMNPPSHGGGAHGTQTEEPEEHHVNKRIGQFGETGQPPLMKK